MFQTSNSFITSRLVPGRVFVGSFFRVDLSPFAPRCGSIVWDAEGPRGLHVVGQHWPTFLVTNFWDPPIALPKDWRMEEVPGNMQILDGKMLKRLRKSFVFLVRSKGVRSLFCKEVEQEMLASSPRQQRPATHLAAAALEALQRPGKGWQRSKGHRYERSNEATRGSWPY